MLPLLKKWQSMHNNKDMQFPYNVITTSAEETESIGYMLAELVSSGSAPNFIAMYGDLGVGKTAFVRGFCSELCPNSTVKSPTFALVNEYRCTSNSAGFKKVCHFDMYRVTDEDDLYSIGYYDYLRDDSACIAEWCELSPYALPDEYVKVEINKLDEQSNRSINITIVQ